MAYNMNQFGLTDVVGVCMNPSQNTIQAMVDSAQGTSALVAGDAVSFGTNAGGIPTIIKQASGKYGYGIIVYNQKTDSYTANMMAGVALSGSIISVAVDGVVARGNVVKYVIGTGLYQAVASSTSGIGIALDIGTNSGDIVRILVAPGATGQ